MKTQMKFQKYMCLVMLIMGALTLLYAFFYLSGGMSALGQAKDKAPLDSGESWVALFPAAEGKYNYKLFEEIQPFNNLLMYCGIAMILTAVLLYITACNSRRNYYITNYVATGVCAGGNIVLSLVLMVMNGSWRSKFTKVDFTAWQNEVAFQKTQGIELEYSESTLWFDLGFVIYTLMIVASILLILNLVWKILLMKGEKELLNGKTAVEAEGGAV